MFEIIIASPPDRNKLVAEIWYNDKHVAEINQETDVLNLELYSSIKHLPLEDFLRVIDEAKKKLVQ